MMFGNTEASRARLGRARADMREVDCGAFLVRDTFDIAWLTAFDRVFDEESAHALLLTDDAAVLHTDSRYAMACETAAVDGPITVDTAFATHVSWAVDKLSEICARKSDSDASVRLGIQDTMSLREFRGLEKSAAASPASIVLAETRDRILALRAVKDDLEQARMKEAQAITDAGFSHIIGYIKVGMTEREVQRELDDFMMRQGATGLAFPTIVATGAHAASPHAQPGDTVICAGDAIVMDFGAKKDGYCSDMTRMVFMGQPDAKQRKAYETLRRANEGAEALLKAGITGRRVHEFAEEVLAENGFGGKMGHALGHGVGLECHESPVLAPRSTYPLAEGNVVTVEPGIYLPGEFGMRLEDFGVIAPNGYAVLTQSTHDMVII